MRRPITGALLSALLTLTAAMALRAADATIAVAAVAAVAVLFTWYAQLHSTDERGTLGLANPASAVTLAVVGRRPWSTLLPVLAAHTIGAVLGGLAALALDDRLGDTLVFTQPGLVITAVGATLVGLVGAWATLSVDGGGHEGLSAVPVIVGGAVLPLGLVHRLPTSSRHRTRHGRPGAVGRGAGGRWSGPRCVRNRRIRRLAARSAGVTRTTPDLVVPC